jgi:GMP synthase (glutamine-hydrolysing)
MKNALAIRHVHFEDLGALEPLLEAAGYRVEYLEAPTATWEGLPAPDLLLLLGGPLSVNDARDYPFLLPELSFVKQCLQEGKAVLGLCLGAQLMARALGARVYPMQQKEVGWSPLSATEAGQAHPLRHLALKGIEVLHFHGETFDLPEGATLLASTPLCEHQAFSIGARGLGLQFHPEVTALGLESWWVGHTGELAALQLSIPELRAKSYELGPRLAGPLKAFLTEWLATL